MATSAADTCVAMGASIGAKSYPAPVSALSHRAWWIRTSPAKAIVPSRSGGAVVVVDDELVVASVVVVDELESPAATAGCLSVSRDIAYATPPPTSVAAASATSTTVRTIPGPVPSGVPVVR